MAGVEEIKGSKDKDWLLKRREWLGKVGLAAILCALYILSRYDYPLFHGVAELFAIVIAFCIFTIAWNSKGFLDNHYLLFIGVAYFFVGCVDLLHMLSYKGMGVFPGSGVDLATQLWIGGRAMEALSLLLAVFFIRKRLVTAPTAAVYAVITALLVMTVFWWRVFPTCFVEGVGLTPFKKVSEYVISGVLLAAFWALLRNRGSFDRDAFRRIEWSIALTIASELAFTFYVDAFGFLNFIGHVLKIASFYFMYKAIIEKGFRQPSELLFRELSLNRQRLQDANEELTHFAYIVSHDLKAPLRALSSLSTIIEAETGPSLSGEGKEALDLMRKRVRRMADLIDGVLQYSRAGRAEDEKMPVDLHELVVHVIDSIAPPPHIKVSLEGRLPTLVCGEIKIAQVFQNLIGNAVKYNDKPLGEVKVGWVRENGYFKFIISDNGPGIEEKHFERIFQLFQTLKSKDVQESTGVGLAIVRKIVQGYGGKAWVESKVGEGSAFYFTVPAEGPEGGRKAA